MRLSLRRLIIRTVLAFVLVGLLGLGALAQNPPAGIGPATNGESKKIMDGALDTDVRVQLQDAIQADDPGAMSTAPAGHELYLGPGEGAEIDRVQAVKVPYDHLPAPLRDALAAGIQ